MSLGQYLAERLAGMQLDCPVLPVPALSGAIADDGAVVSEQRPVLVDEIDELAPVAVLSNN